MLHLTSVLKGTETQAVQQKGMRLDTPKKEECSISHKPNRQQHTATTLSDDFCLQLQWTHSKLASVLLPQPSSIAKLPLCRHATRLCPLQFSSNTFACAPLLLANSAPPLSRGIHKPAQKAKGHKKPKELSQVHTEFQVVAASCVAHVGAGFAAKEMSWAMRTANIKAFSGAHRSSIVTERSKKTASLLTHGRCKTPMLVIQWPINASKQAAKGQLA